jgi:hypothetical protein
VRLWSLSSGVLVLFVGCTGDLCPLLAGDGLVWLRKIASGAGEPALLHYVVAGGRPL